MECIRCGKKEGLVSGYCIPCIEELREISPFKKPEEEPVQQDKPSHYKGTIQPIDFIKDQQLNFNLGNVVKYVCRCNHSGKKKDDLLKAVAYLSHEIDSVEK